MVIPLADIVTDGGTQVRVQPDEATVADYALHMTDGARFPPIVVFHDGNQYFLADGFHRVLAARRNDWREIDADVRVGTKTDALWFALAANKANGRRLTEADKKHAIELALVAFPDRSQNQIADQIGCSQRYVSTIREQVRTTSNLPDRVTGKDGKSYPASRPAPDRDPRMDMIATMIRDGKSNEEIIGAIGAKRHDLIADVRREMGVANADRSKEAVAQRKRDIAAMAARGFSTKQIAGELGLDEKTVASIAKRESIVIHADRLVGGRKLHDANRIIEQMAMDAENLTADVGLIEFRDIDPEKLDDWIRSFKQSQRALGEFVKRLIKEHSKHGQAA